MAHNYVRPEVQDIADVFGDSYELARKSREIDASVIVLCGVRFMAETVKLLNPAKTVLLPDLSAGCPMADMADADSVAVKRREYPDAVFVCYVNTTAAVKALCDVCCTSSNSLAVIQSIPRDRRIVFLPDRNLGSWLVEKTGRDMILWGGCCPTHQRVNAAHLQAARDQVPGAEVIVHPECAPSVRAGADVVLGTSGMLDWCRGRKDGAFIIGTEEGLIHRLRRETPEARFFGLQPQVICQNMKKITLEKVLWSLEEMSGQIEVPPDVSAGAIRAIDRMMMVAGQSRVPVSPASDHSCA